MNTSKTIANLEKQLRAMIQYTARCADNSTLECRMYRLEQAIHYLHTRLERDTLKVWRAYVPTHMFTHSARYGFVNAPVRQVIAHPPGTHEKSPIVNSMWGVQIITSEGERWIGADNAYIDGSLRMVCERVYNNDKVLARWEKAPARAY